MYECVHLVKMPNILSIIDETHSVRFRTDMPVKKHDISLVRRGCAAGPTVCVRRSFTIKRKVLESVGIYNSRRGFPPNGILTPRLAGCVISCFVLSAQSTFAAVEAPIVVCDAAPFAPIAIAHAPRHVHRGITQRIPHPQGVKATRPAAPHSRPHRQAHLAPTATTMICRSVQPAEALSVTDLHKPVGWAALAFLGGAQQSSSPAGAYSPIPAGNPENSNGREIVTAGPAATQTAPVPSGAVQSLYPPNLPISLPFESTPDGPPSGPSMPGNPSSPLGPPAVTTVPEPSAFSPFLFGLLALRYVTGRRRARAC
jgi:hypothetical protein